MLAIWSDGSGRLIGADGRIYLHGQPPIEAIRKGDKAISMVRVLGHKTDVTSADFSPDGSRVVTSSWDNTARIWDAATGREISVLNGDGGLFTAAFSPDGSRIVASSREGTAQIWDAATGRNIVVLKGHEDAVTSAAFSPDGSRIVTASMDHTARVWDADSGLEIEVLEGHESAVSSAAFSPDGSLIVTASLDMTARVWDAATGRMISVLKGHDDQVSSAAFSPDGSRIVTASYDNTARVWAVATGQQISVLRAHENSVFSAAFSPDGSRIATASGDKTARLWDATTGRVISVLNHEAPVRTAAFSPDGGRIVTASMDNTRIWEMVQTPPPLAGIVLPDGAVCWTEYATGWACSTGVAPPVLASLRLNDHARGGPLAPSASRFGPDATGDAKQEAQDPSNSLAQVQMPANLPADATFRAVAFRDAKTLFVIGDVGVILVAQEVTTTSATFKLLRDPQPGERLTGIRFDGNAAWVTGQRLSTAAIWPFSILMGATPAMEPIVLHADDALTGSWQELRASPAPWSFVAAPLVFLVLGYFGVAAARGAVVERRGIADAPSSDSPIGWRDRDALRLRPIALAMSRFIRNLDTRPPLTIAVTGGWGTGKSSLMNLLREDLQRYGARPVWFNAWHHREETSLLAALLEAVRSMVVPSWYTWTGMAFRLRLLAMRLRRPLQSALAAGVLLLAAIGVADWSLRGEFGPALTGIVASFQQPQIVSDGPGGVVGSASGAKIDSAQVDRKGADALSAGDWSQETAQGGTTSGQKWLQESLSWFHLDPKTGLGALVTFAAFLFVRRKLIAFPVEPARLLNELRSRASVADFRDKLSFRSQFADAFSDVCRIVRTATTPGIVIIIDDLDRCPPETVLAVLEAVNYLVSAGPCFVVLGIDRKQIEHAVGLGFKDIVEGLPDRELGGTEPLPKDADASMRAAARRRAFARRYLEKLINIETAVPPLQPEAAVSMLVDEGPEPGADPRWVAPFKRAASFTLDFCRAAAIAAVIGGFAALLLEPFASRGIGVSPPTATLSAGRSAPASPVPTEAAGAGPAAVSPEKPFRFEPAEWHAEQDLMPRWAWWVGDGLLVTFAALFLLVGLARRRLEVEKDSDAFAETLREVTPFVYAANPTPRAVKLFENRMRYLAARLEAEANPRRPDLLDRIVRPFLPMGWFDRNPPALNETKLLILGADEVSSGKMPGVLLSQISDADRSVYNSIVNPASAGTRS
ncbi:P-loop NTPase fold protein [Rhizobium ruizarguesonis]|uniref:P-loop NTPase fold protein n=1 Tax=Rhizobium ruizarguesonis TaxID=2081791 RepID=UPI0018D5211A|nr:P-loop NTPase fold protein [Rhizobium ruizarguesonis]